MVANIYIAPTLHQALSKTREREIGRQRERNYGYYMTDTILESIIHLIFVTTIWDKHSYFPLLTNKKTEKPRRSAQSSSVPKSEFRVSSPKVSPNHYPIMPDVHIRTGLLNESIYIKHLDHCAVLINTQWVVITIIGL